MPGALHIQLFCIRDVFGTAFVYGPKDTCTVCPGLCWGLCWQKVCRMLRSPWGPIDRPYRLVEGGFKYHLKCQRLKRSLLRTLTLQCNNAFVGVSSSDRLLWFALVVVLVFVVLFNSPKKACLEVIVHPKTQIRCLFTPSTHLWHTMGVYAVRLSKSS